MPEVKDPTVDKTVVNKYDPVLEAHSKAEVGMWVQWWEGGRRDGQPRPAMVMLVGGRCLALHIYDKNYKQVYKSVSGARYHDDPMTTDGDKRSEGTWEFPSYLRRVLYGK